MKKYKISNIGIGDLVNFATNIILKEENEIYVSIDENSLVKYKGNPKEYELFSHEFIQKLLPDTIIHFSNDQDFSSHPMDGKFIRESTNPKIISHFSRIFDNLKNSNFQPPEKDFVVLSTKTRNLKKDIFNSSKNEIFDTLNALGYPIILVGEKEIEYNYEYSHHGKNLIYSIYDDSLSLIKKEILIDKTVPRLGLTTPDIKNILSDMFLVYNSHLSLTIGVGGFFCMSIFSPNTFAFVDNETISEFCPKLRDIRLFKDKNLLCDALKTHQKK